MRYLLGQVENYVPGKLAEMGFGYEDCKKLNPRLIYASVSGKSSVRAEYVPDLSTDSQSSFVGYGQSGPYSRNPGYDVNIEAEAGLMHITGEPDGPPVKVGVAITDLSTGLYVKGAILAALFGRTQSGEGVHIDANLFDSQIASLANIASNYLIAGQEATRQGTSHPSIVPYQVFSTKDGFIMIGAGNGELRKSSRGALLSLTKINDQTLNSRSSQPCLRNPNGIRIHFILQTLPELRIVSSWSISSTHPCPNIRHRIGSNTSRGRISLLPRSTTLPLLSLIPKLKLAIW